MNQDLARAILSAGITAGFRIANAQIVEPDEIVKRVDEALFLYANVPRGFDKHDQIIAAVVERYGKAEEND